MTAGRGIIHSEMPQQEEGLLWGFQLWVNLASKDKFQPARYRDISKDEIPQVTINSSTTAKVIAGRLRGESELVEGPVVRADIEMQMYDVQGRSGMHDLTLSDTSRGFLYVFDGELMANGTRVERGQIATFGQGERLTVTIKTSARYLLLAGKPIGEPIVQYGPFVMNTQEEIEQAINEYQTGSLA